MTFINRWREWPDEVARAEMIRDMSEARFQGLADELERLGVPDSLAQAAEEAVRWASKVQAARAKRRKK